MERDLQRAGEKEEATINVLKKLEFTRDILHGLNSCWKLFDTVILCVLWSILEGLFYLAEVKLIQYLIKSLWGSHKE